MMLLSHNTIHEPGKALRIENLGRGSLMVLRCYMYFSCIFALLFTVAFAFLSYLWTATFSDSSIPPTFSDDTSVAINAALVVVCVEGVIRTFAALVLMFILFSFPQRTLIHAEKMQIPWAGEQVAVSVFCLILFISPSYSVYGAVAYWVGLSDTLLDSSETSRVRLLDLLTVLDDTNLDVLNVVIGGIISAFTFAFWGALVWAMGQVHVRTIDKDELAGMRQSTSSSISSPDGVNDPVEAQDKVNLAQFVDETEESGGGGGGGGDGEGGGGGHHGGFSSPHNDLQCRGCMVRYIYCVHSIRQFFYWTRETIALKTKRFPLGFLLVICIYLLTYLACGIVFSFQPSQVPFVGLITLIRVCGHQFLPPNNTLVNLVAGAENGPVIQPVTVSAPSMVDFSATCGRQNGLPFARTASTVALFSLEVVMIWWIGNIATASRRRLSLVPYHSSRAKQLGIIFFMRTTSFVWFFIILCGICSTAIPPIDYWSIRSVAVSDVNSTMLYVNITVDPLFVVGITPFTLGFSSFFFLLALWIFVLALAYLPGDSYGFMGWFKANPEDDPDHGESGRLLYFPTEQAFQEFAHEFNKARNGPKWVRNMAFVRSTLKRTNTSAPLTSVGEEHILMDNNVLQQQQHDTNVEEPPLPLLKGLQLQLGSRVLVLETEILLYNMMHVTYNMSAKNPVTKQPLSFEAKAALIQNDRYQLVGHVHNIDTDTHAFVVCSDDRIVVMFRGTVSMMNIRTDLDSSEMHYELADGISPLLFRSHSRRGKRKSAESPKIHAGFFKAWESVRSRVFELVEVLRKEKPERVVFVTGHSLGGGLAVLCAFDFAVTMPLTKNEVALTTWGTPCVGNFSFVRRFARVVPAAIRFVNAGDIITKLPMAPPFQEYFYHGWWPCGNEVILNSVGNMIIQPSQIEAHVFQGNRRWGSLEPHLRLGYGVALMVWALRNHHDEGFMFDWWLVVAQKLFEQHHARLKNVHPELKQRVLDSLSRSGIMYKSAQGMVRDFACQTAPSLSMVMGDSSSSRQMLVQERVKLIDRLRAVLYDGKITTSEDDAKDMDEFENVAIEFVKSVMTKRRQDGTTILLGNVIQEDEEEGKEEQVGLLDGDDDDAEDWN